MGSVRIWVDNDFQKMLKKDAAEAECTLQEYTKRLAKKRGYYEFPY